MNADRQGLVVIGAGQMRTGTLSLKTALELLYGGSCYHMMEVIFKHNNHIGIWIKVIDQGFLDEEHSRQLFQGYICAVDNPVAPFYKDLMRIYPNAKVILTTRNSTDWLKSVRTTTMVKQTKLKRSFEEFIYHRAGMSRFTEMHDKLLFKAFKTPADILLRDDEVLKKCFEEYNEEVRRTVPKDRLLEFNAKDGWEPLCKFLNLPIPDKPYPCVNKSEDFNAVKSRYMYLCLLKYGSIVALVVAGSIFMYRRWN